MTLCKNHLYHGFPS